MKTPVVLFAYNRPEHLRRTLAGLAANDLSPASDLFVFSDGPRTAADEAPVAAVRRILKEIRGFRHVEIVEKPRNEGLAASVIKSPRYLPISTAS